MDAIPKFEFSWATMNVALDGHSILDIPRLRLKSMEEATDFMLAYGFDPNSKSDLELLWTFFADSVSFIDKSLTDPEYPKVPDHLRSRQAVLDLRRLLLMASSDEASTDQRFACGILRVMHVLIHLNFDPRHRYFQQMQVQVLARLDRYLHIDPQTGVTYLGKGIEGEEGIKLLFFKKKERKDRDRELIKLLHKADSVVEDIYDRVGVRLVTETKLEALKAVRVLIEKNIISLPNIRPGRSRNRLVDVKRLRFEIGRIDAHLRKHKEPAPYIRKMVARLENRIGPRRLGRSLLNPHTSEHYRAIQFTCRELVRVPNPQYKTYQSLQDHLLSIPGGTQLLAEMFPSPPATHEFGFFPYEVQVMDVKAYADSVFGKSNHEEYRRKQLDAARNRVFGRRLEDSNEDA